MEDPTLLNAVPQRTLVKGTNFLLTRSLPSVLPDEQPVAQPLLLTDASELL